MFVICGRRIDVRLLHPDRAVLLAARFSFFGGAGDVNGYSRPASGGSRASALSLLKIAMVAQIKKAEMLSHLCLSLRLIEPDAGLRLERPLRAPSYVCFVLVARGIMKSNFAR